MSLSLKANITPRQHNILVSGGHLGVVGHFKHSTELCNPLGLSSSLISAVDHFEHSTELYNPLGLSLPNNDDFKSLLVSLSTRLTNRYLITWVIQDHSFPGSGTTRWYNAAKPFVWHRNGGSGSVVGGAVK